MDLESEIDRLYGVPLDEFIAERDAFAKQLSRQGDPEAGARVKSLRKPTVGAWALNQAIRRRRKETEALLATADRLHAAQEALLSGGDPSELRKAVREERELTSKLADSAEAIASEAGKSGPALRDRVRATLHAAAVDEEARAELETGRFTREREAVGLGAFGTSTTGGASAPARKPPGRKRERPAGKPARPPKSGKRGAAGGAGRGGEGGARGGGATGATRGGEGGVRGGGAASRGGGAASRGGGAASRGGASPAAERAAAREAAAQEARLAEAEEALAEACAAHEAAVAEHASALGTLESAREALREAEVNERDARRVMREHERELAKRERKVERMRPKR